MNSVEYTYDHSTYVIDNLDKNSNSLIQFKTSADIAIFIAAGYTSWDSIDELMTTILAELSILEMYVTEKNGVPINKKGESYL